MRLSVLGVAALALQAAPLAAQSTQVGINSNAVLGNFSYARISSVGWYWTPSSTFFLTSIQTKFNPAVGTNANRPVTVELWSNRPTLGGSLLASAAFQSNIALGNMGGGVFAPFLVQSGMQYFIGFRNVQGLGVNYTMDNSVPSFGNVYISYGPRYDRNLYHIESDPIRKPILQIDGNVGSTAITPVPEPLTMTLLATGLLVLGGLTLIRRRQ